MGLLSKVGEGIGTVGGTLLGIAGDVAKGGVNLLSRVFLAGDENQDPMGLISTTNNAFGSAVDGTTSLAKGGLESTGRMLGQTGDDMLMKLASPKTPAVPGYENDKGIV